MRSVNRKDADRRRPVDALRLNTKLPAAFACLLVLAISSFVAVTAGAQQPAGITVQQTPAGSAGVFVIRNARIVSVSGVEIEDGTIVIRDGKIESVGASPVSPAGAQVIDGRGLT